MKLRPFVIMAPAEPDSTQTQPDVANRYALVAAAAVVLLLAAWLRWRYLTTAQPYPDEFVTMLAVKRTAEIGAPVLPSGLFYEHGLLFSYTAAAVTAVAGFCRESVRATSLGFGLLAVALTWRVGRRWFGDAAGLWAGALMAVAPAAVLWAGRARMYAMLQFWVLLALFLLLSGAWRLRPLRRWLGLAAYLCAVLTQFVSITLGPPLVAASLGLAWWRWREGFRNDVGQGAVDARQSAPCVGRGGLHAGQSVRYTVGLALEGVGWLVVALAAFLVKRAGQPTGIAPLEATPEGLLSGVGQVVRIYGALPGDLAKSWQAVAPFYSASGAWVLTLFAVVALVWAVVRLFSGRAVERDAMTLALAGIQIVTTLEMVLLVSAERRDDKYLVMLLPVLALLAADGAARLADVIRRRLGIGWGSWPATAGVVALALAALALFWSPTQALLADRGDDYDAAFGYVNDQWRDGDKVLTGTPAAAAVYLGRNDYYAVRGTLGYAYRILERDGRLVDRWMGSPWLETQEQLHAALSAPGRVWLVLERWGLVKEYYSPAMQQQVLALTEFVREDDGVIVLRSSPGARLLPEQPGIPLDVDFDGRLRLTGCDVRQMEDRRLGLVFFWQVDAAADYDYSVFVHLRDEAGTTLAQADHLPLAPVFPPTLWPVGQTVRERSWLTVPAEVPAGSYRLWVGLYRLDTMERLPIVGDTSGENAALLGTVVVE